MLIVLFELFYESDIRDRPTGTKTFGKDRLRYWRTTNKQEIDFIVVRDNLLGFEVKSKYPGKPSVFNYFESQYPGCHLNVVALEGKIDKSREFLYPWEIASPGE